MVVAGWVGSREEWAGSMKEQAGSVRRSRRWEKVEVGTEEEVGGQSGGESDVRRAAADGGRSVEGDDAWGPLSRATGRPNADSRERGVDTMERDSEQLGQSTTKGSRLVRSIAGIGTRGPRSCLNDPTVQIQKIVGTASAGDGLLAHRSV
ncbi:hypothetical protein FA13DRAFT_1716187 [Coprinellus micaceus]|uniref:Uncharacterized protein n=1 Tax=Coprinellus micaceus TaxID=71717 RepID=A0A4Y7SK43_COPMI|nr:hypothetical protein FA13DRAFT_1716187 [Coprinellus micaceus]